MADIFISYKREERRTAERLSIALEQLGFDVWWDFDLMSGDRFRNTIRAVIDQCPAAIVLWSKLAIDSDFVMDEATYAKSKGKLCPARLDQIELPFGFGQVHTDDLSDWDGELSHPGFQGLVRALETRIGRKARLGAVRRDAEAQAQTAELDAFKAAQLANNQSALKSFLNDYPRGMFAGFVRGQLEAMRAEAPASAHAGAGAAPVAGLADFGGDRGAAARPASPPYGGPDRRSEHAPTPAKKAPPYALFAGGAAILAAAAYFVLPLVTNPQPAPAPAEVAAATNAPAAAPAAPAATEMSVSDRAEIAALREQLAAQQQATEKLAAQQQAALQQQLATQAAQAAAQQAAAQRPPQTTAPAATAAAAPFSTAQLPAAIRTAVESARASETRAVAAATQAREAAQEGARTALVSPENGYGVFNGSGDFVGDRYAGQFANGQRSGYGVYTYGRPSTSSSHCEGQYANSQRNGGVVCYYRTGGRFSGDYKNADRNGYGVYRFEDGRRNEGAYVNGSMEGYGVTWTQDGRVKAAGVWKAGVLTTPMGPQGQ